VSDFKFVNYGHTFKIRPADESPFVKLLVQRMACTKFEMELSLYHGKLPRRYRRGKNRCMTCGLPKHPSEPFVRSSDASTALPGPAK
jgi:hypothetical protein